MYRSLIKGCMYCFLFSMRCVCVCTYVYFFYEIRYVMQENVVIFLILHIFIYFTVILMLNSHEVIQKCFYFLCLLNYVCVQINAFFWLKTWGEKKHTGYIQLQILICRQYYILWLNQFYFSIFSWTEHWGLSVPLILSLQLTSRESLNPLRLGFQTKLIGRWDLLPGGCDCSMESAPER